MAASLETPRLIAVDRQWLHPCKIASLKEVTMTVDYCEYLLTQIFRWVAHTYL